MTPQVENNLARAQRLQSERKRLGYSEAQLATLLGISTANEVELEQGARAIDPEQLGPLYRAGVDMEFLDTGRQSTVPPTPLGFPCWSRSNAFHAAVELLRKSVQAVDAFVGAGAAERSPELVAALMQATLQRQATEDNDSA